MLDLPPAQGGHSGWVGLADAVADWIADGAGPSDLDVVDAAPGEILNAAWTLYTAGALHGAAWICGALPPEVALARLWMRVRPQQAVSRRGLAGLADDCLAALDHRPGPTLVVIDNAQWSWRGWEPTGPVLRVWLRGPSGVYPDRTGDDFDAWVSALPALALAEKAGELAADQRVGLAGWYREMGAAAASLAILPDGEEADDGLRRAIHLEAGKSLAALGRHAEAIGALDAWRASASVGTVDHVLAADVDLLISASCALLGRWAAAEASARQALSSRMATSGEDSVWAAAAMVHLGRIFTVTDRARDAERCFRCAVTLLDAAEPGGATAAHVRARWLDALEVSLRRGEIS